MKQRKQYKYIGRNGIITSPILLDGIGHIPMMYIEAEPNFILTNGERYVYATTVETEQFSDWREVVDNTKKDN